MAISVKNKKEQEEEGREGKTRKKLDTKRERESDN